MTDSLNQRLGHRITDLESAIEQNKRMLLSIFTYISLSTCFNCCRDLAIQMPGPLELAGLEVLVSLGEIVGFFGSALYLSLCKPGSSGQELNTLSAAMHGLLVLGALGHVLPLGNIIASMGAFIIGANYAGALTLVLKNISALSARHMAIVVASGFFSSFALSPYMTNLGAVATVFTVLVASAISCAGTVALGVTVPATEQKPYVPSWRLVAFVLVIPLVFGFCNAQLTGTFSQFTLKIGYAISSGVILLYAIAFREQFTLLAVHWILLPLAIVGCACALMLDVSGNVAKTLVSANLAGIYILSYMLIRIKSHNSSSDPAATYALVSGLIVTTSQVSRLTYHGLSSAIDASTVAVILILAIVLVYGILILQPDDKLGHSIYVTLRQEDSGKSILAAAQQFGLSQRETTVFALMADQHSAAQIADELCISTAAVRTHMSRIYAKLGVHNRKEFDNAIQAN